MAAQERAKQVQMKQASSTTATPVAATAAAAVPTSAPIEQKNFTMLPEPNQMVMNEQKQNAFDALNGLVDNAIGKDSTTTTTTTTSTLPSPSQLTPVVPPMANVAPVAIPPMANVAPAMAQTMPPPSFEIFEQQQKKEEEKAAAFDNELSMLGMNAPTAPPSAPTAPPSAPTAPPTTTNSTEETLLDTFGGVEPIVPPQQTTETATNEEEAMLLDDDNMFEYDMNGNKLSPEERRKLMEEQRAIMEQIQKQSVENKASEAAVRANAFETRMTETALTQNMSGGGPSNTAATAISAGRIDLSSQDVDLSCVDSAQVEEQRAILEEIERQKAQQLQGGAVVAPTGFNNNVGGVNTGGIAINGGYQSPDFAIPKTQQHNPNIAESAREAIQMEEDRKLAEALQQEENRNAAASAASNRAAAESEEESTWWDTIVGSMGGTTTTETEETHGNQRSAEINISRPPGSMTPSQRALHGSPNSYEREGLLGGSGGGVAAVGNTGPQAARVAESKPLFSCVVDSVASAATAAAAGATSMVYGEDEEVNGVDTTSFLSVPKAGDERGSSGDYSAI